VPELPEVEIIRLGISPYVFGNTIVGVTAHSPNLRWPISPELFAEMPGQSILSIERRGKYLLLHISTGFVLIHLGMTGYLRILPIGTAPGKHDHFDIIFKNNIMLRLNDVRRLGSIFWVGFDAQPQKHLLELGPEPLTEDFNGTYLFEKSRSRKVTVKQFIMDHKVVAGIGNIYANEALFYAKIQPTVSANKLSFARTVSLAAAIKSVLTSSIRVGGTMLDFRDGTEKHGSFNHELAVYKRGGQSCAVCAMQIQEIRVGRRSVYYCSNCQH